MPGCGMSKYSSRNYYHVTLESTLRQILVSGAIDPTKARGKRKVSWYVLMEGVPWAIAHVLARHKAHLGALVVLRVQATDMFMHQFGSGKLYYTRRALHVVAYESVFPWLLRDEAREQRLQESLAGKDWYEHLRDES